MTKGSERPAVRMTLPKAEPIVRNMPDPVNLGHHFQGTLGEPVRQYSRYQNGEVPNPHNLRVVMGYKVPTWQRPLVWTHSQKVAFIESAWKGIPLGTYTFNRARDEGSINDEILIDGQQRMSAIQDYIDGIFPVFGYHWGETTIYDQRRFRYNTHFPCYITETEDEAYLRGYYNLMNFGGTAHEKDQMA